MEAKFMHRAGTVTNAWRMSNASGEPTSRARGGSERRRVEAIRAERNALLRRQSLQLAAIRPPAPDLAYSDPFSPDAGARRQVTVLPSQGVPKYPRIFSVSAPSSHARAL